MSNIYSRLFKYRQRADISPLENFLTEGLVNLLSRFDPDLQRQFLLSMLPKACHQALLKEIGLGSEIVFKTQFAILFSEKTKFPDIAVLVLNKPLILIEFKVRAPEQQHTFLSTTADDAYLAGDRAFNHTRPQTQGQLRTYSRWIAEQRTEHWPGAVVFLTHETLAPDDFGLPALSIFSNVAGSWKLANACCWSKRCRSRRSGAS